MGGRRWWILAALLVAVLPLAVDLPLAVVTIPALSRGLGTSLSLAAVTAAVVPVTLAVLLGPARRGARRHEPRTVLAGGLLLCLAGQVVAVTADGIGAVAVGRALVAGGGALTLLGAIRVVNAVFEPAEQPRAIAVWAGFTGLALVLAPVLGGALVDRYGWRAACVPQVPLLAVGLAAVFPLVRPAWAAPEAAPRRGAREVVAPLVIFVLLGSVAALSIRDQLAEDGRALGGGVVITAALAAFAVGARGTAHLLVRSPRFAVEALGCGACALSLTALSVVTGRGGLLLEIPLGVGAAVAMGAAVRADPVLRLASAGAGVAVLGSMRPGPALLVGAGVALSAAGVGWFGGRRGLPPP